MEAKTDYEIEIGDSFSLGGKRYEIKIIHKQMDTSTLIVPETAGTLSEVVGTSIGVDGPKDRIQNIINETESLSRSAMIASMPENFEITTETTNPSIQVDSVAMVLKDESRILPPLENSANGESKDSFSNDNSPVKAKPSFYQKSSNPLANITVLTPSSQDSVDIERVDENLQSTVPTDINVEEALKEDFYPNSSNLKEANLVENASEPSNDELLPKEDVRRSKRKKKQIDYSELEEGFNTTPKKLYEELLTSPTKHVSISEIFKHFKKSTFVSSQKTLVLYHEACTEHKVPEWHSERPERLQCIMEAIDEVAQIYTDYVQINNGDFDKCSLDVVYKCHEKKYLDTILSKVPTEKEAPPLHATMTFSAEDIDDMLLTRRDSSLQDTFVSFGSWDAALYASGSVCKAIDEIMDDTTLISNAFCAVRPPGHHAGRKGHARAMTQGYCIINNVAIGCQYILDKYNLKRVAVFDFDVHQGNGTQEILETDERVLFISLHGQSIYPFTGEELDDPSNKCTSNVINIGYERNISRKDYMTLFRERVIVALERFQPECIFLSAGFDAHQKDPTKACKLNILDYINMTREIKKVANMYSKGRIVSVLEGGYELSALKKSVTAHLIALMESVS